MNQYHAVAVGALIVGATVTVAFILSVVLAYATRAARILAVAQFVFSASMVVYVSWTNEECSSRFAGAAAIGGAAIAVTLLWSGIRLFHDRSPRLEMGAGAALLVALAVPLEGSVGGAFVVTAGALVTIAASIAMIYELQVGSWVQHPVTRIFQGYLASCIPSAIWWTIVAWQGTARIESALVGFTVVQTVAAFVLLQLLREHGRVGGFTVSESENPLADLDVLSPQSFRFAAQGRLNRVTLVGGHACFLLISIEDLRALNSAFGRSLGDDAVRKLAETVRAHVPPWAPIGHLGAGNFAVLAPATSPQSAHAIVSDIEDSLLTSRTATVMGVRIGAVYGVAATFSATPEYGTLLEQAITSMAATAAELKTTLLEQRLGKS